MSRQLIFTLAILPIPVAVYAYLVYPAVLALMEALRSRPLPVPSTDDSTLPAITITVPCYNEAGRIRETLDALLRSTYPPERMRILVISDASTDGTDDVVREYSTRGVELLRMESRAGKSVAENLAASRLWGDVVVNVDATTRLCPDSLTKLVSVLNDPAVGLATGRNVSVASNTAVTSEHLAGENRYVGYEMWVRSMETRVRSIIGGSGCFYAIRRNFYDAKFPAGLSRDFASALAVWEAGRRAVLVNSAVCYVPRTTSFGAEYQRKVRTMARGLHTLWHRRDLLNPFHDPMLAWMLFSHKLARWLVFALLPISVVAIVIGTRSSDGWRAVAAAIVVMATVALLGVCSPRRSRVARLLALTAFAGIAVAAGVAAWWRALFGAPMPTWEPTRR